MAIVKSETTGNLISSCAWVYLPRSIQFFFKLRRGCYNWKSLLQFEISKIRTNVKDAFHLSKWYDYGNDPSDELKVEKNTVKVLKVFKMWSY